MKNIEFQLFRKLDEISLSLDRIARGIAVLVEKEELLEEPAPLRRVAFPVPEGLIIKAGPDRTGLYEWARGQGLLGPYNARIDPIMRAGGPGYACVVEGDLNPCFEEGGD